MKRRAFIAALAALPLAPAALAQGVVSEVSKYLNQLRSVQGRFTQINSDVTRSSGRYFIRRPGFIRFEYDGGQDLVISDGVNIGVFDAKSNRGAQRYPLGTTPLRFLLRDRIDLGADNLAAGTSSEAGFTYVTLRDPANPGEGSMTLKLQNSPPTLRAWTVREKSGAETTVQLDTLEKVGTLDRRLFNIEYAEIQRARGG